MATDYDQMSTEELLELFESRSGHSLPPTAEEQVPQVQATEGDAEASSANIADQRIQATRNVLANKVNSFSPEPSEV